MWIVRVALQRPYTFLMLAVLIVLMGGYAILNTATDIFPNIKIPIAAVIWRYNGILPEEIANRIVLLSERIAQTTVNDVEHTESQSVTGTAVVKYFFHRCFEVFLQSHRTSKQLPNCSLTTFIIANRCIPASSDERS